MKILFVHQNFPAQFGRLAAYLAKQPEYQIQYMTREDKIQFGDINKVLFREHRTATDNIHPYILPIENAVIQGQAVYKAAARLKAQGFIPDVIYGHSGFGATMFAKDVFPKSAFIGLFEWYFHSHGGVHGYDPDLPVTSDDECKIRTQNMTLLIDLTSCEAGVTSTHWQYQQFPAEFSSKLHVLHEGIDIGYFSPQPERKLVLADKKLNLTDAAEIITYVARGMEPVRGFPQFMQAMSQVMKRRKSCHVVVVGADRVAYGFKHASGKTYKELLLEAFPFDMNRLHFTGVLGYDDYRRVLQASTVHVYLTYPYILSWSMLEAMACGCTVVASATPPVQEVITHGENGILVDMLSIPKIVAGVEHALEDHALRTRLGKNARESTVINYDMHKLWPRHVELLREVSAQRR